MALPHLDTDRGVNFASAVNSFNLALLGADRYQIIQHSDYPTIPILTEVLTATLCYCS